MIINVKPDQNHRPTYIVEGQERRPSIVRQVWNGIVIAFKIFFIVAAVFAVLYFIQKSGLRLYIHGIPIMGE